MIRALIVDDEAPARAKVRKLLAAEDDFEVVGEAADGEAAVEAIREHAPDVVFLDVQMPRLDGFGVIAEVGTDAMPAVVFVTAFDEHAIRAFEVHALDYLLKPFAAGRFGRVLEHVRRRLAGDPAEDLARRLEKALAAVRPAPSYVQRLTARVDADREVILPVAKIDLIRAHGNYLRLHTPDGVFQRRATLTALAERLDPEQFLRVNRSEIVRLDAVAELQPWFHGDYRVLMKSGETLTWSRRYRARAKDDF